MLLVEDDSDTREIVAATLEAAGAVVTGVVSATAAIRALDRCGFDIVITDYALPGDMTGYRLLRHIRSQPVDGRVPIIGYSSHGGLVPPEEQAAFTVYAPKPLILERLVDTCRRVLAGAPTPDAVAGSN